MANATRRVLASHGADPATLALIAYGGNGAVHAWAIAAELGIDRILVPKAAPAFSALGVLVADYVVDLVRAYVVPLSQVDLGARRARSCASCATKPRKELDPTGLAETQVDVGLFAQMCYPGQNFDMSVPVPEGDALDEPGLLDLAERFHDQHEADRGFCFRNQQPLLRGVRLVARGYTPKPERLAALGAVREAKAARRGERRAYFGPEFMGSSSSTRRSTTARCSAPASRCAGRRSSRSRSPWWWCRRARPPASTSWATTSSRSRSLRAATAALPTVAAKPELATAPKEGNCLSTSILSRTRPSRRRASGSFRRRRGTRAPPPSASPTTSTGCSAPSPSIRPASGRAGRSRDGTAVSRRSGSSCVPRRSRSSPGAPASRDRRVSPSAS